MRLLALYALLHYLFVNLIWLSRQYSGLVTYYKDNKAMKSLLTGTLISLAIYILWQFVVQGNIPREGFKQVIADGGNIGNLLAQCAQQPPMPLYQC